MRGKGGKAFLDALCVAHVAVNLPEYGNLRALSGDKQTAHRHQAKESHHFQRHRLAARVRTADEQKTIVFAERKRNRDDLLFVYQRVTSPIDRHDALIVDLGLDAGELVGVLRPRVISIDFRKHLYIL